MMWSAENAKLTKVPSRFSRNKNIAMKKFPILLPGIALAFILVYQTVNASSFPDVDQIKEDLIGRQACNWQFDSMSEFRKFEVINKTSSNDIIEYDLGFEVEADGEDRIIVARAIYNNIEGRWILETFEPKQCSSSTVALPKLELNPIKSYPAIVGADGVEVYLEPDPFAENMGSIPPNRQISIEITNVSAWLSTYISGQKGYLYADQVSVNCDPAVPQLFLQFGYSPKFSSFSQRITSLKEKGVDGLRILTSNQSKAYRLVLGPYDSMEAMEIVKKWLTQVNKVNSITINIPMGDKKIEGLKCYRGLFVDVLRLSDKRALFVDVFRLSAKQEEQKKKAEERKKLEAKKKANAKKKAEAKKRADGERKAARTEGEAGTAMGMAVGAIQSAVTSAWVQPQTSTVGLEVVVRVNVGETGVVTSARVVRSSGNALFDRSAEIAILKASPLPIPSNPMYYPYLKEFDFRFSPNG